MLIRALPVGPLQVNCFIVGCAKSRKAMVIDPGDEVPRILAALAEDKFEIVSIVNTHGHFDHVGGNRELVQNTGVELLIHKKDVPLLARAPEHAAFYGLSAVESPAPDRVLEDGDRLKVGELEFEVIHTPGHSPGGICLYGHGHLFSGDALFAGSIGRTDLPGCDHNALIKGIRSRLMVLPEETVVHPGHGPDTTIGREKRSNPFVGERS